MKRNPIQNTQGINKRNDAPQLLIYVHSDCLGDAMFKLPAIAGLRHLFPGFYITWLAGRARSMYSSVLRPLVSGYLDEVHECAGIGASWRELLWPAPLAGRRFDIIIDTQTAIRPTLCLRRVRHGLFISAAANYLFSDKRPARSATKTISVQRQLLDLLSLACGRQAEPVYNLECPGEYHAAARQLLPPGRPYGGLAPGAGGRHKCWPLLNYIALAREMNKLGLTTVFLLGPEERSWRDPIRKELPDALFPEQEAAVRKLPCGPLLTLALAQRLTVAVTNDSGAGHVLAAARRPLISLFGPTSPDRFAEAAEHRVIIRAQQFGGPGLDNITVGHVVAELRGLLDRNLQGQGA